MAVVFDGDRGFREVDIHYSMVEVYGSISGDGGFVENPLIVSSMNAPPWSPVTIITKWIQWYCS